MRNTTAIPPFPDGRLGQELSKMKYGKDFSKQMKDPEFLKAFAREGLIIDIQEEICRLMEENDVSRNELAKRMGKTKGFITQILNSGRNLTLRTVTDVFTALEAEITVKAKTTRKASSIS
jgi:predicted DNA-binding protein (UPF0251 family)